ncbi:Major Facilitator Superfamily protein [Microbacterium hydrothermale]|nr:Major Facilitator Superfamily protein [Microbacterium hydrothermale]
MFLEAGFTPAALTHLSDISAEFRDDRGLIMGAYSVVVGAGYVLGNILGGAFAQWLLFDGLALLTIGLAAIALVSIGAMAVVEKRVRRPLPRG